MDDVTYSVSRQELYHKTSQNVEALGLNQQAFLNLLQYKVTPGEHNAGNAVTNDLKLHIRLARQYGIHVSPTVLINGLIAPDVQSSWGINEWDTLLKKYL